MVRYKDILERYFMRLKSFYINDNTAVFTTAELSFRPLLDGFFEEIGTSLSPNIQRIFEPRIQGKYGRPDWVFTDTETMGVYGYVEAKALSPESPINQNEYQSQVSKYLNLGNPVLLTDGIEFIYYDINGSAESFCLFDKPVEWTNPKFNIDSLRYFQSFFSKIGFRTISEQSIIKELSERARLLCYDLMELLNLDEEEAETESELTTIKTLKALWDSASSTLDASLSDDKTFAGFISQILAFGLLYAHRFIDNDDLRPIQKYDILHYFWSIKPYKKYSNHVQPFVHLFNALSNELDCKLSKIGAWYDNTRRLLSFVKLSRNSEAKPNFHQLYEAFLSSYDKDTRTDFGAWYTPIFLADYLTRLVYFNIQVKDDLKKIQNNPFHVIDPCCGTGTFLECVLDDIPLPDGSMLSGFEILPVPYALANYRLSVYQVPSDVSLSVLLTNTLGDNTFHKPEYDFEKLDSVGLFFAKEQVASFDLSQPPLTIIIGNPPCSDSSITNAGSCLEKLMEDFRPPIRRSRQNTQMQLTNEWIKFLRWGLYKAIESKPSIIAFILPSAFAANISFKYARKYLIEHANEISIVEFDSDNRVESANRNIFNTLQGRLLIIASFTNEKSSTHIHYKDLRHLSRSAKVDYFSRPIEVVDWEVLEVNEDFALRPVGDYDEALYSNFVPLTVSDDTDKGIFLRHCSGAKLSPTHLLVHFDKGQLSRRCKYIGDESHSYEDIKERWYSGQAKPPAKKKITSEVRKCIGSAHKNSKKYAFRPFLEAYVNDDKNLLASLANTDGGGMRFRPEVNAAFSDETVLGFALAPAPAEINRNITKFCSFCWHLPDNDLSTRGNAHVFCNKFPLYKSGSKKKIWNSTPISNINRDLLKVIMSMTDNTQEDAQNDILFYAYAILSSPFFLKKFSAKLHALAGQTPAIPITSDSNLFNEISLIGKRLSSLEKKDYVLTDNEINSLKHLSWSNTISDFELKDFSIYEGNIELVNSQGNSILITLPNDILTFNVSGYNVVREWLKYHSYSYFRKPISTIEIEDFLNLVRRIALYFNEYDNLNEKVAQVLSSSLISILT